MLQNQLKEKGNRTQPSYTYRKNILWNAGLGAALAQTMGLWSISWRQPQLHWGIQALPHGMPVPPLLVSASWWPSSVIYRTPLYFYEKQRNLNPPSPPLPRRGHLKTMSNPVMWTNVPAEINYTTLIIPSSSGRAVYGVRLQSLACWDCGFKSYRAHVCLSVCCECCLLSGRGLCDKLITCPEESYWLWCVVVCVI